MSGISYESIPQHLRQFLAHNQILSFTDFILHTSPEETQWYTEVYLNYIKLDEIGKRNGNTFVVDFTNLCKRLLFRKPEVAVKILKSKFQENVDYRVEASVESDKKIFLTTDAACNFAENSGTKKGKREYLHRKNLEKQMEDYELLQKFYTTRKTYHDGLVKNFKDYPVVYLADIHFPQGQSKSVAKKLGWSNDLERTDKILGLSNYTHIFTHVFRCLGNRALVQSLVTEEKMQPHIDCKNMMEDTNISNLFEFSPTFVETDLIRLIQDRLGVFNVPEKQDQEVFRENNETVGSLPVTLYESNVKKNNAGYKIQQIHPDNLDKPVAIFESPIHVVRTIEGATMNRLVNAISDCTLYLGYRWIRVSPEDDLYKVHYLPPTKVLMKSTSTKGLVAKLDKEAKVIKRVFANQSEAMKEAGLSSRSAISTAIKTGRLSHGHAYRMWDNCTAEQRAAYENDHGKMELCEQVGKKVVRLDPNSKERVEVYNNIQLVLNQFHFSRESLHKAIENDIQLKGWYWKFA